LLLVIFKILVIYFSIIILYEIYFLS